MENNNKPSNEIQVELSEEMAGYLCKPGNYFTFNIRVYTRLYPCGTGSSEGTGEKSCDPDSG